MAKERILRIASIIIPMLLLWGSIIAIARVTPEVLQEVPRPTPLDEVVTVGEIVDLATQRSKGQVNFKEHRKVVLDSIVYGKNIVETTTQECKDVFFDASLYCGANQTIDNSWCGTTVNVCSTTKVVDAVVNASVIQERKFTLLPIEAIEHGGKRYEFDEKGCWVCGDKLVCLSKEDGYAENRAEEFKCDENNEPVILPGEDHYFIKDLAEGRMLERRGTISE